MKPLGRLEKVDLREAWLSEASDFTPWLTQAENLKLLGEAIGIELECEAQEKDVGPFRADILCKGTATDSWVLIENQLERTDHSHLGQLLTYAAGLEAVTVVWIAERFTEEHRAALDWLNQHTSENINFFGLEVELWKIGDSPKAPKFNVVSKPNEWSRTISESARNVELSQERLSYWTAFVKEPALATIAKAYLRPMRQGHLVIPVGWQNFKLTVFTNRTDERLGIYISCCGPKGAANCQELLSHKPDLERRLSGELIHEDGTEENKGWLILRLPDNDANNHADWPRQHRLLVEKTVEFYKCFDPYVRKLEGPRPVVPLKRDVRASL